MQHHPDIIANFRSYKAQEGIHPAMLCVVDAELDGTQITRTVEVVAATPGNMLYLHSRAESFVICGVPAMISELLDIGACRETKVERNHYFAPRCEP